MENRKIRRIIKIVCLVVFVACLIPIGQACRESMQSKAQQEALRKMTEVSKEHISQEREVSETGEVSVLENGGMPETVKVEMSAMSQAGADNAETSAVPQTEESMTTGAESPVMLAKYVDIYQENSDLVGWVSIEDMKIDYPILQNANNEYYLHHDFYGNDSKYGCLYVKNQADVDTGTNFIVYGHNMKDGSMFGDLDLYQKESFYKEHSRISFDTLYEERAYDVIAVFRSQVYNAEDDVFKYYQFYEAGTQAEFDDFYNNIKELSLYDTGVEAKFGDTFLTLSTCAYHVQDGRFVVVAKRIR